MRLRLPAVAAMTIALTAAPALAHGDHGPRAGEHVTPQMPYEETVGYDYNSAARAAWLADCRHRLSARGSGISGAVIDRAENPVRHRDQCEAYLDDYYSRYTQGAYYPPYGYTQGYAGPTVAYGYPATGCCMAQPMMMVPLAAKPECTETVEYVYEDVPVRAAPRKRRIPRATKIVPDKRVRIAPEKMVPTI